ncbi:MAG: hypothetical protein ACJA2X_000005 [Halocynthiibacter sp.]|jgi:hypothetical protein
MKLSIFVLLRSTPNWLNIPREQRNMLAQDLLVASGLPDCAALRFFDAEAFASQCTDILMIETDDLIAYQRAFDRLRDGPFFTDPYFEIAGIIPAVEDGFKLLDIVAA